MTVITEKVANMESRGSTPVVRLAMREVREAAYRALMARGASNSEAQAAARQVLFAEMHHGTGLQALSSWLRDKSWAPKPLDYTKSTTPAGLSYLVGPGAPCNALVHGVLLVDVASTGAGSEVLCNAVENESHLLDEALLNAALGSGLTVVHRTAGDRNQTTFATPAGDLGIGFSTPGQSAPHTAPATGYGSRFYTANNAPEGVFIVSTASERTLKRTETARDGIHVNAKTWAEVRTVAAAYLVADA
ncbi:hypothetical protein [Pseudarthrobacter sp. NBSH8]|uniref:hypothetical protein n=1 Tax=Pseudarthrobacter sp. NBSH8 TaxID=2596911 RepID=UPI00162758F7|nr:hypothetical protein [Pseudarthrobacter sp. NBSH8]QNE14469.1 hypothetical protein FYJ92_08510 [Pseudarthrobacter sp. NBSH8]